jgi:hypothetical protein
MEVGALATKSVLTVGPDHSLKEVAERMTERNVGAASSRDLVERLLGAYSKA